jgi:hypothetical protein
VDNVMRSLPTPKVPALVPDVIGEDTLWAMHHCGYCEAACPSSSSTCRVSFACASTA